MRTTRRGDTRRSLVAVQATEADAWLIEHRDLLGARWLARGSVALRTVEEGSARARQLNA